MAESNVSSNGIGFFGLLAIVFITLKLTHVIDWSWWWVLAPLYPAAILLTIILLIVIGAIIVRVLD